jgi:hypothetical protein
MFVRQSTLDRAAKEAVDWMHTALTYKKQLTVAIEKHNAMVKKWNELVEKINARGGEDFLEGKVQSQFSADELTRLIQLCHPDKHDGKSMAVELTQKLIQMKESLK